MRFRRIIASLLLVVITASTFAMNVFAADVSGVRDFVTRMYQVCLNRTPDASGLNGWTNVLIDKKATGCSVAYGFIYSPEFQNKNCSNEEYVRYMYNAFFGRQPDSAGFQAWVNALNNGTSRENVFAGFANSVEFGNLCSSYGVVRGFYMEGEDVDRIAQVNLFVDRLYGEVLGRNCDNGGMEGWTKQLVSHANSGCEAAYGFVFSQEFIDKHLCDSCYLNVLYKAFMGREADSNGKTAWINVLNGGASREEVFNGFACSDEFTRICEAYGIDRGSLDLSGNGTYRSGTCTVCGTISNPPASSGSSSSNGGSVPSQDPSATVPNNSNVRIWETGPEGLTYSDKCAYYNSPVDPTAYTYEVIPLSDNMNGVFYIKTDNPDPWSFALYDPSSKYYSPDMADHFLTVLTNQFPDVVYENPKTGRVHGGYLALSGYRAVWDMTDYCEPGEYRTTGTWENSFTAGYTGQVDGGYLKLLVATSTIFHKPSDDSAQSDDVARSIDSYYRDSGVTVQCPNVVDPIDYVINKFSNPRDSFFDKMDSIQRGLSSLAVYPSRIADKSASQVIYPCYAISPYMELTPNRQTNVYPYTKTSALIKLIYPFILHSESFPDFMTVVALRLEPSCVVERGVRHETRNITFNGVTKMYGGMGCGGNAQIDSSIIRKTFLFDGSANDYALNGTLQRYRELLLEYKTQADLDEESLDAQLLELPTVVGSGAWVRVAMEGYPYGTYSYAYADSERWIGYKNIWIDGRYVNSHYCYEDITFEESRANNPTILLNGKEYVYIPEANCWVYWLYVYEYYNGVQSSIPSSDIITDATMRSYNIDRNHSTPPAHGYIYDGTAAPGTPF